MKNVEIHMSGTCTDDIFARMCVCLDELMIEKKAMQAEVSSQSNTGKRNQKLEITICEKGDET